VNNRVDLATRRKELENHFAGFWKEILDCFLKRSTTTKSFLSFHRSDFHVLVQPCTREKSRIARQLYRREKRIKRSDQARRTNLDISERKSREPPRQYREYARQCHEENGPRKTGETSFPGEKAPRYPARYESGRIEKSPVDPLAKPLSRRDTCGGILDGLSPLG